MHFMLIVHLLACRCIKRKTIRLLRLRMVFVSQTFHWKQSTDTFFVALDRWVGLTAIEILEINNELILNICVFFHKYRNVKEEKPGNFPFFIYFLAFLLLSSHSLVGNSIARKAFASRLSGNSIRPQLHFPTISDRLQLLLEEDEENNV